MEFGVLIIDEFGLWELDKYPNKIHRNALVFTISIKQIWDIAESRYEFECRDVALLRLYKV
jgi:hypothetical protein